MRMASHNQNPVVVAIDKDKNSSSAVKWAIENLVTTNTTLILVHFKNKNFNNYSSQGGVSETYDESNEDVFTHPRAYCARKKVIMQEVVLEGTDVHNTLLDHINNHHVTNIVLGASSRNPITRKFWSLDVPAMINRGAPDFCSVYVISRGRTQSVRPAARQALASSTPPRFPSPLSSPRASDNGCRAPRVKEDRKTASSHMIKPDKIVTDGSMDHRHNERWSKTSFGDSSEVSSRHFSSSYNSTDTDLSDPFETGSMDITQVNIPNGAKYMGETTNHERTYSYSSSSSSSNELQRLKLEVKQTMNMYNSACKQAISAQHQVDELHQMKQDEVNRLEHARVAEEAANALIEVEKAKCRAAIEAAEKAQKIAERETQRRKHAEQKAKREAEEKNRALDILSKNDIRYRKYTIDEIEAATNKFSRSMKIGEGGYGPVYKGKLDHTRVAIKVLRSDAAQGRKQFQQEVEVLSFMRHPNMVLLMGACPEYGCLVYEYMNNGSLEDRLFRKGNTLPIPWGIRFKLASDIATGLLFLHQAKPEPLVHRDLKPGNILLDRHYTCKISDVGLARLVPPSIVDSVTQYHMTNAAGTFCYIDPEYQQTGKLGTKSDIYSLGVMLLQIITARPPMGLTHHVEKAIETGTFGDLLDPTVPDWPVDEAIEYARLALKCTELRKRDRPDLCKDILPELNRLKELGMEHELRHRNSSHR